MSAQEEHVQVGMARNVQPRSNMLMGVDRILNVPRCYVACSAANAIANGQDVLVFNLVARDTDGMFSSTSPTRVTIRTQGIYDAKWNIVYANGGGGTHRQGWIRVNGGASRFGNDIRPPNASFGRVMGSDSITLNAGDYLELITEQDAGAWTLAPGTGYNGAELNVTFLSSTA